MRFGIRTVDPRLALTLLTSLAALVVVASTRAGAQESTEIPTTEYVVRPGDTCAIIAGRLFGSRQRHDLIHAYNPTMGPPPHDLVPGTRLIVPVRAPDAASVPDARVTQVRRDVVSRTPSSEEWRRATRGEALFRGYRVNALERSSAQLTFRDTSVLEIRANTLVVIFGASTGAARAATGTATLETGTLRSRLGSLRMTVDTPSASAELDGGSSVISADDAGSRVASHEGRAVRVRSSARGIAPVRLAPGYGSVVAPGAPPSPPTPLPAPPRFETDDTHVFAAIGDHGAVVRGRFEPVGGAARYHVEILRAGTAPEVIASVDVPADVTAFELRDVDVGTYQVTIATIDRAGLEGVPGTPGAIRVVGVGITLPDESAPRASDGDAAAAQASGEATVPPGTVLSPPPELVCAGAAADGSVRLDAIGVWTFDCHLADGAVVGGPELDVRAPPMTLVLGAGARETVERGAVATIALERTGYVAPLPESARFEVSPGLRVVEVSDDGRTVTIAADASADDDAWIALVLADRDGRPVELARLPLAITSPAASPEVVAPAIAEPLRPGAGVVDLVADPFVIGARATAQEDFEATTSVGAGSYANERPHLSGRFDVSIRAHDRVRLDLGIVGTADRTRSPGGFGGSGFVVGGRAVLVRGDDRGLVASIDVVAPLHPSATLEGPMLRSAISASLRMTSRSFLRPSLGVLADLGDDDGLRASAASVAAILVVDRRLSIGWLVDTRLGRYDDAVHGALGIGAHLGFDYERASFTIFGRTEPFAAGWRLSPTWTAGAAVRASMRRR